MQRECRATILCKRAIASLMVDVITLRRSVVIVFCKLYVGKTPFGGGGGGYSSGFYAHIKPLYTLRNCFVLHTEVVLSSEVVNVAIGNSNF